MTTIATDGKSMAGDGLVTSGDAIFGYNLVKVRRAPDGRIAGASGTGYDADAFHAWLANGGDPPKLNEHFEALVLYPDGTCRSYDSDCRSIPEELPSATGSGRLAAIGAMEFGAGPERAVEIACARDAMSGGKITVLHLEPALAAVA